MSKSDTKRMMPLLPTGTVTALAVDVIVLADAVALKVPANVQAEPLGAAAAAALAGNTAIRNGSGTYAIAFTSEPTMLSVASTV